jgi:GT2 family glycosyltransferase
MTSSFIICTKDRPVDLQNCIKSIASQTVLPQEVIIVDASNDDNSVENQKNCEVILGDKIKLIYIKSEPSTTRQRNMGVDNASGNIVFFVDDDTILKPDYHEKMLDVYQEKSGERTGGVSGTVENYHRMALPSLLLHRFFMLTRYSVNEKSRFLRSGHYVYIPKPKEIIPIEGIQSCVGSYYRKVFNEFRFDENLSGYALGEDIELSYRISRKYKLYQTPYAVLYHYLSATNRSSIEELSRLRVINIYYLFKKNIPQTIVNRLCLFWSLLGCITIDFIRSLIFKDMKRVKGDLKGVRDVLNQIFRGNSLVSFIIGDSFRR